MSSGVSKELKESLDSISREAKGNVEANVFINNIINNRAIY